MTVVDMTGVKDFKVVPVGEYPVTLTGVKVQPAKNPNKEGVINDIATFEYTIHDDEVEEGSEQDFNGQKLWQGHVLTKDSYWKLKQTLIAFDCDPDDITSTFNLEAIVGELMGNKAIAVVVPNSDPKYRPQVAQVKSMDE